MRDGHQVGEKPSPFKPTQFPEAVHRHPRVGRAVARAASPAGLAHAARDLEGQHGPVAGGHRGYPAAGFDYLDDPLVAERVGAREAGTGR